MGEGVAGCGWMAVEIVVAAASWLLCRTGSRSLACLAFAMFGAER